MEGRSVPSELRANHTGQPLNDGAQVFGVHLLQFNRNCDVEQPTFAFARVLCSMREQTAPEHPSEADERVALAQGAFVTSTATDDLAIQAEGGIQEREDSRVLTISCFGEHRHQLLSLGYGQLHPRRIERHSQGVSCQSFQWLTG